MFGVRIRVRARARSRVKARVRVRFRVLDALGSRREFVRMSLSLNIG